MEDYQHLKVAVVPFVSIGRWEYIMPNNVLQILYNGYGLMTNICVLWLCFGIILKFFLSLHQDLKYLAECFSLVLLTSIGTIKIKLIFTTLIMKLVNTVQCTEKPILRYSDNSRIKIIFKKQMNENLHINALMWIGATLTIIFYTMNSVVSETTNTVPRVLNFPNGTTVYRNVPYPIQMWVPYDRSIYFGEYLTQCFVFAFFIVTGMAGANNILIGIMSFVVGQLKCLQHELINITNFDKSYLTLPEINLKIYENVRKAIIYHQNIIRFVEELNQVGSTILFIEAVSNVGQIAISSYYLTIAKQFDAETIKFISHLTVLLYQLFVFNWYGNEIIVESKNVADACYKSKWYICNTRVKRMLLIVMIRSQKPLQIFAGPLFALSMPTMLMILKSSYTYSATLREFVKK